MWFSSFKSYVPIGLVITVEDLYTLKVDEHIMDEQRIPGISR